MALQSFSYISSLDLFVGASYGKMHVRCLCAHHQVILVGMLTGVQGDIGCKFLAALATVK